MTDDHTPQTADYDGVKLDNETYDDLVEAANSDKSHTVNESADKIRLDTKVKRGDGTRDQDEIKVQVKGDDPTETVKELAETLDQLEEQGVAHTLRETQPGEN